MKNRKQILIVDDVTTNLRFLGEVLKDEYSLSMAKSGKQALKLLDKNLPNLILLDVKMPEMDGYETFERIKANSKTSSIPVVFLSADTQKENEEKGLKLGAKAFIRKPFDPSDLMSVVANILKEQELESEMQVLANTDTLTGLWNRKYLEKIIKDLAGNREQGSLIIFDFNKAQEINQSNKVFAEEDLIIQIGKYISSRVHKDDFVARNGGFEFSVIMKNITDKEELSNRLTLLINDLNFILSGDLNCDESSFAIAGISQFPLDGITFNEVYNCANKALYLSKTSGKDFSFFFSDDVKRTVVKSGKVVDLSQLHSIIDDDSTLGPMIVDYEDFKDLYRFMKRYAQRNNEILQLVLFTVKDLANAANPSAFEKAMNVLETAIRSSLRKNDAACRYSDSQFLVVLTDLDDDNRRDVIERVTECFEATCGNTDILLTVDVDNTSVDN